MRLIFFSLSYPTPWQPTTAVFNHAFVEMLRSQHEVRVVAPVPWTQRFWARRGCSGALHPLYVFPPKVLRQHYGTFLWLSTRRTLRALATQFRPDAFLGYWAHPDGEVTLRAAREAGRPGVVIVGGTDVMVLAQESRRREAIRRVLQGATAVLTVGRTLRGRVIDLGTPENRVTAFYRGVDDTIFRPGALHEARVRLGLPIDARIALWVGRMVPVKGLEVLLDAWGNLAARVDAARLVLVGEGPERRSLQKRVTALGLDGTVTFAGPRRQAELADWYRAADVTVLPSLSEGIPNVLLESLACGTPFVASDVGGVSEIDAGPGCELVPSEQPGPLSDAIERLLRERRRVALPAGHTMAESAATIGQVLKGLC